MAISKRAIDLTDGIYVAYGSGSAEVIKRVF